MELAMVEPPHPSSVRRIATVGGGPAALSFLLQLKSKIDALLVTPCYRVEIVVLDRGTRFGPGQGFARWQSTAYRLNFPRKFMEPEADVAGVFSAWLRDVAPQCTTEFPPRRFFGLYLEQMGKRLLAETVGNPFIGIKFFPNCEVNDIECDISCASAPFCVQYSDVSRDGDSRGCLEVDEVLLCTGTFPGDHYREFRSTEGYGYDAESNCRLMAGLQGNESIGIIGSRLSAIDLVMELRKRRHTGTITLGSENGLLPAVSTFYTVEEVPFYDRFSLKRRDSTDSGIVADIESTPTTPKWSEGGFQRDDSRQTVCYLVGKPIPTPSQFLDSSQPRQAITAAMSIRRCNGLRYLHPLLISESASVEELSDRFFAEINAMILEDWRAENTPRAPTAPMAHYEKITEYLANISPVEWLNQQIKQAEHGIIKPYHALFFQLYPHISKLWAHLSEDEMRRYYEKLHWLFMSFYSAFPLENAWPMREMLCQGRLAILRECKFFHSVDGFVMEGRRAGCKETESRRVTHLFNAAGHGSNVRSHPLYSKLLNSKLLRPHRFGGVEFENDTYRAISGRTKAPIPSLYVIGEMTKGQILISSCIGIIAKQADKVASQVFERVRYGCVNCK
ncbi:hypothetical protein TWF694_004394 [Orbilia ellipsospora]|uniref:FAD-dependent urate hydroxylase HpyO/Asp monooxygenase CreE-like FAD/NAD(P)-binding domain-containing protein n=1 Tax=Orbilia ellipsospora TaxID=2528407 RepID=A0AAV9WV00_9PEZI